MTTSNDLNLIPTPKQDAIHRALLAGLLSNLGSKSDGFEYTGARNSKFHLFPGSTLFKERPKWVMSAELVETTKLYARTNAKIQPEWAERIGEHLVKRTYADPHWNRQTAHVVAYERVTLYGLPLIPKRTVHYGPIDPVKSREIFIQMALVEHEWDADPLFFRHNAKLVDEIETLEAKSRQSGLLATTQARYDFYDRKIPAGLTNGPAFEKWRREIERANPKFLHMTRNDLLVGGAGHVTQDLFPDALAVAGVAVPLEYHFEPGHPADGVTASVPLAALSRLKQGRFDWVVPGLLKEKITGLIKSLPKGIRVNFVPVPQWADQAFDTLKPDGDTSLLEALSQFLGVKSGQRVPRDVFDPASLFDHLHMNFNVIDEAGKVVAHGRDLEILRRKLGVQIKVGLDSEPIRSPFHRDKFLRWDFDDFPDHVDVKRAGLTLPAYPAVVDAAETHVNLRLFDTTEAAQLAHRAGVRRLFMLQVKPDLQYIARTLPRQDELFLRYATLGTSNELKQDVMLASAERALFPPDDPNADAHLPRKRQAFNEVAADAYKRLNSAGLDVARVAEQVLVEYHALRLTLQRTIPPLLEPNVTDIKQHLNALVGKTFLSSTPPAQLVHLPRYVKGISVRLTKLLNAGYKRDMDALQTVRPLEERYVARLYKLKEKREPTTTPALQTYRWLLEELRVSLFAQELKTSVPVSTKRLDQQWQAVLDS